MFSQSELVLFTLVPFDSAAVVSVLEKDAQDRFTYKSAPNSHSLRPYDRLQVQQQRGTSTLTFETVQFACSVVTLNFISGCFCPLGLAQHLVMEVMVC